MKGLVTGLVVASLALAAAPQGSGAATTICPPPPCVGSPEIVCPLDASQTAIVYCACPIAVTGTTLPVLDLGCVDLSVTERVDRAMATVGDRLTYVVDVRNSGPDPATDVTLTDALPPGLSLLSASRPCSGAVTCSLGTLGAGEAATTTLVARASQPGKVTNTVTASSSALDLDPSNDQATAETDVRAAAPSPPSPPSPPAALVRWCSPSGDVCFGRLRGKGPIRLGLTLAARYFRHYSLCVTAPDSTTACKRFRVRRTRGGTFGSVVRWHRRFPDRGKGTYRAAWSSRSGPLGPPISFSR